MSCGTVTSRLAIHGAADPMIGLGAPDRVRIERHGHHHAVAITRRHHRRVGTCHGHLITLDRRSSLAVERRCDLLQRGRPRTSHQPHRAQRRRTWGCGSRRGCRGRWYRRNLSADLPVELHGALCSSCAGIVVALGTEPSSTPSRRRADRSTIARIELLRLLHRAERFATHSGEATEASHVPNMYQDGGTPRSRAVSQGQSNWCR